MERMKKLLTAQDKQATTLEMAEVGRSRVWVGGWGWDQGMGCG